MYRDDTLLFVFAAIGVAFFVPKPRQRELVAVAAMLLVSLRFVPTAYQQYWLPFLPLAAVLAGQGLASVSPNRPRLLALMLAFIVVSPVGTWVYAQWRGDYHSLWTQWEKTAYVLSVTDRNDLVYDGGLVYSFFRNDIDYLWFSEAMQLEAYQGLRPYPYDIYELIDKKRPKVITSFRIDNMDDPRIRDHYQKSDRYADLYIRRD